MAETKAYGWQRIVAVLVVGLMAAVLSPATGVAAQETDDADDSCPLEDNPAAPVRDRGQIPDVHRANVDCAYNAGITRGLPDGTYGPTLRVRRDQMAAFIARTLEAAGVTLVEPDGEAFTDLDGNVHAEAINRLAASNITAGVTPTTFGPARLVRRDQIASFVLRAVAFAREVDVADLQSSANRFSDVSTGNVHAPNINGAAARGLAKGRTATTFDPSAGTRRDQMASFLIRAWRHVSTEPGPPLIPPEGDCTIQPTLVSTVASQAECDALLAVYHATNGPGWETNTGWNTASDPCTWHGVSCDDAGVAQLSLTFNNLAGALPPEIGDLTNLTFLELRVNQLTAVPPEIGGLTNLTDLDLGANQLTGLPAEIGGLTNLASLSLGGNQLTALPAEIGGLANLTSLSLDRNQLTSLPAEIGGLSNLTALGLTSNQLTALPAEIGGLSRLTDLVLGKNALTVLPPEIGDLINLVFLDLQLNALTALPSEIGGLTGLTELGLGGNALTALPPGIGGLTNLTWLFLAANELAALPPEIGSLTSLTDLFLGGNALTGLPPEIGALRNLSWLSLAANELTAIPSEIGTLTALTHLHLEGNQLTVLPPEIGALTNLTTLSLGYMHGQLGGGGNQLTAQSGEFFMGGNQLTALPAEIGNLVKLTDLSVGGNQLTAVPPEIGELVNLTDLGLGGNQLAALPPEIGALTRLTSLNLESNQLTALPVEIGQLAGLEWLDVRRNLLSGDITNWMLPFRDSGLRVFLGDGSGANNCLTVTDPALGAWLSSVDPDWAECD